MPPLSGLPGDPACGCRRGHLAGPVLPHGCRPPEDLRCRLLPLRPAALCLRREHAPGGRRLRPGRRLLLGPRGGRYGAPGAAARLRNLSGAPSPAMTLALPGFEEATRELYAGRIDNLRACVGDWPPDVRDHLLRLLDPTGSDEPAAVS
ncbi:DUF2239 family protein [Myxococcota bacterium]|nr:DUF2239 family protein [Myxococcota bacterium]MBU1413018.1 DUF2239 family protein [Myxococcota bacterium]